MNRLLTALTIFIMIIALAPQALAGGFEADPLMSENGFFDITVAPNEELDLILRVSNREETDMTVVITAITSTTGRHGEIINSQPGTHDESLLYPFDTLVEKNPMTVIIPASGTMEIPIPIQAPPEYFEGIILGAFTVHNEANEATTEGGMFPKKVIPVRMTNDPNQVIEPLCMIEGVELSVDEADNIATVSISGLARNIQPEIFKGATVSLRIESSTSSTVRTGVIQVNFAPNSQFPFAFESVFLAETGQYTAHISVNIDDSVFKYVQPFEVEGIAVTTENNDTAFIGENQQRAPTEGAQDILSDTTQINWLQLAIMALCVLLAVFVLIWIIRRKIRKDHRQKQRLVPSMVQKTKIPASLPTQPQVQQVYPPVSQGSNIPYGFPTSLPKPEPMRSRISNSK